MCDSILINPEFKLAADEKEYLLKIKEIFDPSYDFAEFEPANILGLLTKVLENTKQDEYLTRLHGYGLNRARLLSIYKAITYCGYPNSLKKTVKKI